MGRISSWSGTTRRAGGRQARQTAVRLDPEACHERCSGNVHNRSLTVGNSRFFPSTARAVTCRFTMFFQYTDFLLVSRHDAVLGEVNPSDVHPERLGHLAGRPLSDDVQIEHLIMLLLDAGFYAFHGRFNKFACQSSSRWLRDRHSPGWRFRPGWSKDWKGYFLPGRSGSFSQLVGNPQRVRFRSSFECTQCAVALNFGCPRNGNDGFLDDVLGLASVNPDLMRPNKSNRQ